MAAKKSEALEFTRQFLRDKPEASFAEIRDAAAEKDIKLYPIVYGRAKALEGLVEVAPYGSKKKAKERAAAASAAPAPEAEPEAAPLEAAAGSIDEVIQSMRDQHSERERYRQALIRISEILDEIL